MPPTIPKASGGFVYVIEDGDGRSKVGRGKTPKSRLSSMQVGSAGRLALAFSVRCADPCAIEKRAHEILAPLHIRGEWFACRAPVAALVLQHLVAGAPGLQSISIVVAYFMAKALPFDDGPNWQTYQTLLAKITLDPDLDEDAIDRWAPLALSPEEQIARFPVVVPNSFVGRVIQFGEHAHG